MVGLDQLSTSSFEDLILQKYVNIGKYFSEWFDTLRAKIIFPSRDKHSPILVYVSILHSMVILVQLYTKPISLNILILQKTFSGIEHFYVFARASIVHSMVALLYFSTGPTPLQSSPWKIYKLENRFQDTSSKIIQIVDTFRTKAYIPLSTNILAFYTLR